MLIISFLYIHILTYRCQVHMWLHTHLFQCIHKHYIYIYIYIYTHTHVCMYVYMRTKLDMHTSVSIHTPSDKLVRTCTHMHAYTCSHLLRRTCMYKVVHFQIYMCILPLFLQASLGLNSGGLNFVVTSIGAAHAQTFHASITIPGKLRADDKQTCRFTHIFVNLK
jgi:hypothetical protein